MLTRSSSPTVWPEECCVFQYHQSKRGGPVKDIDSSFRKVEWNQRRKFPAPNTKDRARSLVLSWISWILLFQQRQLQGKKIPNSRAILPTFRTNCPDGVSFCPDGVSFCPEYHQQPLFFTQLSQTPLGEMYVHKTPPTAPQNTPFPGLILRVGKTNYCLGKMDPIWAIHKKSGQNLFMAKPSAN